VLQLRRGRLVGDGIRQTFGGRQEGAPALRYNDIAAICKTFRSDIGSVRNKAIILLGFAGGFRRSEIVALNVEDLDFDKNGLTITLLRSKTDQDGKGRTVAIVPGAAPLTCPVAAVKAWLRAAGIEDAGNNALFYPVNRWGAVELNRPSDKTVDRIVKSACRTARLKDKGYSAHSLRAGHVTEALAGGALHSAAAARIEVMSRAPSPAISTSATIAVRSSRILEMADARLRSISKAGTRQPCPD
jgi:integrase